MVLFHFGMSTPSIYKSRRRRSIIGVSKSVVTSLACLFLLVQSTRAQQIGVDVCACQPSVYEFTFDFALTCDDQSVGGAGITDTTCLTELRGEQNQEDADLLPVAVGQVSIFELDQNLDVIAQTVNTGLFLSGSTFTYTSIIATEPELLDPASLPRGIQLVFIGVNALNQAIVNTFAILYNNDCGVFPLLRVGQQAGWIIFTDLGNPPEEVCPIAAEPSSSPSASQTTRAPVIENAPTASPSIVTEAPVSPGTTDSPVTSDEPSSVPVLQPSTTARPSIIICPSGKRRGKGKSKVVKGKSNYEKKRKEHSDRNKGRSKLSIDSGKRRGSPSGTSEDTHGKGKGSSTKSNGDRNGKGNGSRAQSNENDSYEEGRTDSGRGVSGKGKGIEQKQKDGSYGAMSRIGRHHSERLLGIGRVDYQNKNSGGTSKTSKRPSPFEPISGDVDENASGDIVDDSDDDDYDDDDNADDDQEDDDYNDDDDYPECIEPDYASKSGGGKGKGTTTESSKSGGKGKGAPSKTASSKAASTKASLGKGASTKASSGKEPSTKASSGKGSSTKTSSTNKASSKASLSKGTSTKASSGKGKGNDRSNDTGNSGKGKGQSKGTVSGSTPRRGRNKRQRSSQRDSRPMNKLHKGGDDRFRDLMEQEYLNYWGS
ncbi:hypothetical protein FisN_15Lh180 [Fistulifera solaris]|uniref:Uncharacterized protein n=1 Tax=Fistulifera solaris TaxID=1519565 RepID=A0A1Z5KB14_FISSO|nr:hypothetical protein FisN_15Lh180 [Fistulifera solaris]|eukprot:GAX23449.1 hypothetical protein FisN_15Lh180 [Fistulifera solaris]